MSDRMASWLFVASTIFIFWLAISVMGSSGKAAFQNCGTVYGGEYVFYWDMFCPIEATE